ncbi:hypothetical protein [Bacteroides pyogenes]|uniref:hypothetical protein n=1 Tax=Bacteroides pyogenes TaxID=310300 RepID=UPI0005577FC7|nr:hypothetical protein [Bacteroides pyogenes]MBB3894707.1 hypothetical protein [Bacteroides pyogenes]SUV35063.1 Uncharacterised protein [Bacteroides pyogenes]
MVIYYYFENAIKRFIRSSFGVRPGLEKLCLQSVSERRNYSGIKSGVATNSVAEMEQNIEAVQDTAPGDG